MATWSTPLLRPWPGVLHLILQLQLIAAVCSYPPPLAGAYTSNQTAAARPAPSVPCLPGQESALLRLKRSFTTTRNSATAFRSWRAGSDCCGWEGIGCDEANGRVTSLDLGDCGLESGGLDPVVFELTSLRYLNLGGNDFNDSALPSNGFERLTKLINLNLSTSSLGGGGEVPYGIGRLTSLVSLDLSSRFELTEILGDSVEYSYHRANDMQLTSPNFTSLVAHLGGLRQLRLGLVDLSQAEGWCEALAMYTPNLHVLSLPFCQLSGPICASLSVLRSLSVLDLQFNSLSGPFPNFFANFSFLTVLQIRYNSFEGWVSPAIFENKKLVTLDLYMNGRISGNLPNFSHDSHLQNLFVGGTSFSGTIPSSISNVKSLKGLGLNAPSFSGILPSSIGELKSLNILKVSGLDIGHVPSWIANLTSLEVLEFSKCGLHGPIPSYIGHLIKLKTLVIMECKASGEIPPHISNLTQLQDLLLGSNNFTGTVELNSLWRLPNLFQLDLSDNKIDVIEGPHNSSMVSFPNINYLKLASCSITKFPSTLRYLKKISGLDLSNNQISGDIPQWALEIWSQEARQNYGLDFLDFSHNKFTSVGNNTFLPFYVLRLDLSFNMFQGPIPLPQYSGSVLDYSSNMFSSIPSSISAQLEETTFFKASRNSLSGNIPTSFCTTSLKFLDLSHNNFNGSIPSCLMEDANSLEVLGLRGNQLQGELPRYIIENCMLQVLDLGGNQIEGQLPRSLSSCKQLEVLDVGNNELSDFFPCWMSTLPRLQVLVLKYNNFFGQVEPSMGKDKISCEFPSVRIMDLASNNLSGTLTEEWFMKLMSMKTITNNQTLVMEYEGDPGDGARYQASIILTYKGADFTFEKILRTLVFFDVSDNAFQGSIAASVGELVLLAVLNMSHNFFTGPIPSELGHLTQLEALDLSSNGLSGKIPQELASLDFLTTLNVSDNKLVGRIPESPHFMTFSNSSFLGNDGLCGTPLSRECINTAPPNAPSHHSKKKSVDTVLFLFAGLGFGIGFGITVVVAWAIPIRKRSCNS